MNKSRCLIIEDEPHSKERLQLLLEKYHPDTISIDGWAKSYEEAVDLLRPATVDLVFFDIQMQDYNAFDILSELQEVNFDVIFTTAHEGYALKAFRVNAIDYLLKPIDREELERALKRHFNRKEGSQVSMSQKWKKEMVLNKRLEIPTPKGLEFVPIQDIIRCEADGNYTKVFLRDKSKIMVAKTLKEFEKALEKHHFLRPHQSHLVNIEDVKSYHKGKGGFLILSDHTEIEVASRRKEEVLRILKSE
ncbi:response regulator [Indibacter alkaliphilus LW1]|uniref:Response regulator n=1 Tax=Indibacter alkaliphilus (strain CCUG 57479 / KCTC 22604 / LW1) TaxID=1189612 RepID=S2E106_INDAL|nr:LytTR family DNA-binding domain-containing protein [Indibacter alkaliphilus]EOZ98121.1 response regulator [Indibacter alkaliphilus LW1]